MEGRGGRLGEGRKREEEGYRGERKTSSPNDDVIIKMEEEVGYTRLVCTTL